MNRHQSSIPKVAADYFRWAGVTDIHTYAGHPIIRQTYRPGTGWKNYPGRKRISVSWARRLKREGVTVVNLVAGGHYPDFRIEELAR